MSCFKNIYRIGDDFVSLLFPRLCQACGQPLVRNEEIICTNCLLEIPKTDYHMVRDNNLERNFYGRVYIEKAASWSFYRNGSKIQKLIYRLKYGGVEPVGPCLGRLYGHTLKESGFCKDTDLIIPVPLHKSKERRRGFNQSALIAGGLSSVLGIPVNNDILRRVKSSDTQTRKHRYERWENVENIFSTAHEEGIEGKHILLVDDVITTGSTIEACASELLKTEGVRVSVIAIASAVL